MRFGILQDSINGSAIFTELHTTSNKVNALAILEIDKGSAVLGDFSTIDCSSGPYFNKVEKYPTNGAN